MRIITGDECGLLKETTIPIISKLKDIDSKKKTITISKEKIITKRIYNNNKTDDIDDDDDDSDDDDDVQSRNRGIVDITLLNNCNKSDAISDDNDAPIVSFAAIRTNQKLELWNGYHQYENTKKKKHANINQSLSYSRESKINNVFDYSKNNHHVGGEEMDIIKGSKPIGVQSFNDIIACCNSNGRISIFNNNNLDNKTIYESFPKCKLNTITSFALSKNNKNMAVGGINHEVTVLDMNTGKHIWKGKNIPCDKQTLLEYPIWPSCISFLNDNDNDDKHICNVLKCSNKDDIIVTGTGYKQIRIYDINSQRRPILSTPISGPSTKPIFHNRITSLTHTSPYNILCGDTAGYIFSLDMRKMNTIVNRYNGPCGSIKCLDVNTDLDLVSSISLDRFLYIFRLNGRQDGKKLLDRIYLKQRLNSMIVCPTTAINTISSDKGSLDSDDEDDDSSDENDDDDPSSDDSFLNIDSDDDSSLDDIEDINNNDNDSDDSSINMRDDSDDSSVEEHQSSSKKKRKKN